jgi:tetratricopeptide (TPR) repeat protein
VAGIEFSATAVAAALDASIEAVETQCNALVRGGQFIQHRGTDIWPDKTVTERYGFVHALYHETLYNRISANRRVRWHRQIGARLELGYGTRAREMATELAAHFVRGQDVDRAVPYLRYAGEQALQRSAYQEASTHFIHGLDLLPMLPDTVERTAQTIDLCLALRLALHPLGEYERVQEYLHRAEPLAGALGDDQRRGRVAVYRASCFRMLGDHESAIAASQHALAIAADDRVQQVVPRHLLGQSYYSLGDFSRAQELFRQNMALLTGDRRFESFGLSYLPAVGSLTFLVFCLAHVGEFVEAQAHAETSLQLAEQAQHPMSLVFAHRSLSRISFEKGDLQQAICNLQRVIERCRGWHIRDGLPTDLSMLGYAYVLCGRVAEGLPLLERAVGESEAMKTRFHRAMHYARLSQGCLLAGRPSEAGTYAQRAYDLACTHRERPAEAWILRLHGDIAAQNPVPDVAKAEICYQQALALANRLGMRPLCGHCHYSLGTLFGHMGRTEDAWAELSAALALYRDRGMATGSAQVEAALVQLNSVASAER